MNEDYKGFTIYSANKDGGGTFWYMDGVVFPEKYKSLAAAKGAITRHLNRLEKEEAYAEWAKGVSKEMTAEVAKFKRPDIEAVPRTQQEIDDYGPNGIQPPKSLLSESHKNRMMIVEVDVDAIRGKINHPNATVHPNKSRNKREGGYCGRYKAGNKNFKMAHYRVGPHGDYETLKESAKYKKRHFPVICPVSGYPLQQRRKA